LQEWRAQLELLVEMQAFEASNREGVRTMKLKKFVIAAAFMTANVMLTSAAIAESAPRSDFCHTDCGGSVECQIAQFLICGRVIGG
jgi:hypothetical protein